MAPPRIKICGIRTASALEAAIEAQADYAGFVFFPLSPRNITFGGAAGLAEIADDRIGKVGLFVDAPDALIAEASQAARLQILQLHGNESPERVAEVKSRFGLSVWKAVPIAEGADVDRANAYAGIADLLLFDAKTPKGALPGGMGLSFDWSLLQSYRKTGDWGLAGGLNPRNVAEAIGATAAPLVDTSSGVESAPGVKDLARIAAFCKAVRAA